MELETKMNLDRPFSPTPPTPWSNGEKESIIHADDNININIGETKKSNTNDNNTDNNDENEDEDQFRPITADTIFLPKEGFSPKSSHPKLFNDDGKSIMSSEAIKHNKFREEQETVWKNAYLQRQKYLQRERELMKLRAQRAPKKYSWQTIEEEPIRKRENGRLTTSVPRRRKTKNYKLKSRTIGPHSQYSFGLKPHTAGGGNTGRRYDNRVSNEINRRITNTNKYDNNYNNHAATIPDLPTMPLHYNPNVNEKLFTGKMLIPTLKKKTKSMDSYYPTLKDERPSNSMANRNKNEHLYQLERLMTPNKSRRSSSRSMQHSASLPTSSFMQYNNDTKNNRNGMVMTSSKSVTSFNNGSKHLLFNISAQKDHYKYNKYHPNSSSSELLKRKEFQNGGKLSGNLKHGAVTIQNRMVPRRPIIRMSPIQRKIKNVLHNTF